MKAVDTNILLRIITRDDAEQTPAAERIIDQGVFVPVTVMLETGWMLASFYRQQRTTIAQALVALLDLPTVHIADEPGLRRGIELFRTGADLADAIHLAAAGASEAFVTFDRKLSRLQGTSMPVELAV